MDSFRRDGSGRHVLTSLNGEPFFQVSPDGKRILLNRNVEGRRQPVTIATDTGVETKLPLEEEATGAGWSRDGRLVLYAHNRYGMRWFDPESGRRGAFQALADRWDPLIWMSPVRDEFLAIEREALYVVDLNNGGRKRLTPPPMAPSWSGTPTWLPDGARVLFEVGGRIYLCDRDSTQPSAVTTGTHPVWVAPAGR